MQIVTQILRYRDNLHEISEHFFSGKKKNHILKQSVVNIKVT